MTVKDTPNTGLDFPDVFYFGNMPGDATHSFSTDVSDFNQWNANKFTSGHPMGSLADWNHDTVVDVSDFNIWNQYKFTLLTPLTAPLD